jgi:hypothetical protein
MVAFSFMRNGSQNNSYKMSTQMMKNCNSISASSAEGGYENQ